MDCREFLLRYSEYDDSLIPPHEADRFRDHMAECGSCARYDRVLRKGRMVARQLPRPEPSRDFVARLRLRLRRERRRRVDRGAAMASGLAAATVLMVAATAVQFLGPSGPAETPGAAASSAASRAPTAAPKSVAERPTQPSVKRGTIPGALVAALSALESGTRRDWPTREVAPAGAASYSPLETGPPAYRVRPPSVHRTTDSRRALD